MQLLGIRWLNDAKITSPVLSPRNIRQGFLRIYAMQPFSFSYALSARYIQLFG